MCYESKLDAKHAANVYLFPFKVHNCITNQSMFSFLDTALIYTVDCGVL